MKTKGRVFLFISVIVMTAALTWTLKAQQSQQEKEAILRLTKGEIETLYNIIDDAAVPGQVRKPLLQKIGIAYQSAFSQQAPIKDTTKPKKN